MSILSLGLISRKPPLLIHDELVLVDASRNLLDNGKLIARPHHRDLLLPPLKGGDEIHLLTAVGPREHHGDEIAALNRARVNC
eukprot:CAMPEP_0194548754 /NCGR_PEP_ID=MMETSP0253-20130528/94120_1 /TAXON_ID=2966 /ORGANISM="Noctiluca scintillans" /LENGTH=82 /DNA_ID=CAMNT_0039396095 /DNA_START=715 /DNA_END=963 /DNA_ORIENTATION=-